MCRLSRNLGALTSLNRVGLFRPVMGQLYFYLWTRTRLTKCEGHVTCRRSYKKKNAEFWSRNMKNGCEFEDLDFNINTILKHILKKQGRMVQAGLIWRRVGTVGVL